MADESVNQPSTSTSQPGTTQTVRDLTKLECPFTWNMGDITREDDTDTNSNEDEELFPLVQLMKHIMTLYVGVKYEVGPDELLEGLSVCDDIMKALVQIQYPEISIEAVHYVLQSMKCYVYIELKMHKKFKRIYLKLKKDWQMTNKDKSTLNACKSICWSKYHDIGSSEVVRLMRDAIRDNPRCDLWYFILGKNLRRIRTDTTLSEKPSKDELNCFKRAYTLASSPIFGVYLATMCYEMGKTKVAENIYTTIWKQDPTGTTTLLKLAFGFARLRDKEKSSQCLEKLAALEAPNHCMYINYRGIYHFRYQDYRIINEFMRDTRNKNRELPEGKPEFECVVMLDKLYDAVHYMLEMTHNRNHVPDEQTESLLNLALTNWLEEGRVPRLLLVHCIPSKMNWVFKFEN